MSELILLSSSRIMVKLIGYFVSLSRNNAGIKFSGLGGLGILICRLDLNLSEIYRRLSN